MNGQTKPPRHVRHKTGLAAAGRPFQQDRHAALVGRLEYIHLVADRQIIRFFSCSWPCSCPVYRQCCVTCRTVSMSRHLNILLMLDPKTTFQIPPNPPFEKGGVLFPPLKKGE